MPIFLLECYIFKSVIISFKINGRELFFLLFASTDGAAAATLEAAAPAAARPSARHLLCWQLTVITTASNLVDDDFLLGLGNGLLHVPRFLLVWVVTWTTIRLCLMQIIRQFKGQNRHTKDNCYKWPTIFPPVIGYHAFSYEIINFLLHLTVSLTINILGQILAF